MRKGRLAVRELKVVREKIDAQLDRYDLTPEANWTVRTRVKWSYPESVDGEGLRSPEF
jgi:hypothetical protein